jgi:hypothetical protein
MRGAVTASTGDMPKSTLLMIACTTALMITLPPGDPAARTGSPSLNRMVGHIPVVRAFPAAIEFMVPGAGSNSFIELF